MRRGGRKGGGEDADGEAWLATYADMVTLLMAFFVMLYAMSSVDAQKFQQFLQGLEVAFDNPAGGSSILEASPALVAEQGFEPPASPDGLANMPFQRNDGEVRPGDGQPESEPPSVADPDEQLQEVQRMIDGALGSVGLADVASYRYDERGLVVSIATDAVLFETGSASIRDQGRRIVAAIAAPLRSVPNDVLVEGHTDNVPMLRPDYSNWNLSTDRAVSVLQLLQEDHRVTNERLGAVGYGEHRPLEAGDSPGARQRNRRVDVLIVALEEDRG